MAERALTRTCSFSWDARGFVRATMVQGAQMTLADAVEAVAATRRVAQTRRCGVLVDSRGVKSETKEARDYFVGEEAAEVCRAVALLVGSPVSRVIGNFFLRQNVHSIPTRLFTSEADAIEWLMAVGG